MLPLTGLKVVDMAQVLMGPATAVYLADQGAEVIKLEPMTGDASRHSKPSPLLGKFGFGKSYLPLNRNKRSIAVEIRSPEGQEIAHRLAKWADVFILNFRPGAEARVHMDYETLAEINPRLIYAAISAFGRQGPEANLPGYDIAIQARSGVLSMRRDSNGKSTPIPVMLNDMSGCMGLAYAITLALLQREKTGKGQRVDISLLHTALALQMQQLTWVEGDDTPLADTDPNALAWAYKCGDGQSLAIVAVENHQWKALCQVLELGDVADDPRFATGGQRAQLYVEIGKILDAAFLKRPRSYWVERIKAAAVPCSPIAEREELPEDPQTVANQMFWEQDHPLIGRVRTVSPPFQLSDSRGEPRLGRPSPTLGQHTPEVLRELGYDENTITDLRERSVVK